MDTVLNIASIIGTSMFLFGLLYFLQTYTLGFLSFFKKTVFKRFILGDIVFSISSILFILLFVDFHNVY